MFYDLEKNNRMDDHMFFQHKGLNNKLSEVITDYAQPLIKHTDINSKIMTMSIICWNASLMEKEEQQDYLNQAIAQSGNNSEAFKSDFYNMFNMMYKRKQKHFKSDNRLVVDYSLSENAESLRFKILAIQYKKQPDHQ
ncbi:MAG: hypothetical protein Q9M28_01600 [Mariprofundaceae bacterium]|nr:hypothetical protein [Mariprofundaceae bacterium]